MLHTFVCGYSFAHIVFIKKSCTSVPDISDAVKYIRVKIPSVATVIDFDFLIFARFISRQIPKMRNDERYRMIIIYLFTEIIFLYIYFHYTHNADKMVIYIQIILYDNKKIEHFFIGKIIDTNLTKYKTTLKSSPILLANKKGTQHNIKFAAR